MTQGPLPGADEPTPSHPGPRQGWADPLRFAIGTFTRFPMRPPSRVTGEVAGRAMALGPAVGCLVGLVGGIPLLAGPADPLGRLLSALLAISLAAWVTRALHWDGLADFADGLGARTTPERALAVMRRSDIGPFGVLTLVLILAVQVVALARLPAGRGAVAGVIVALAAGRAAITVGSGPGAAPARRDGLGVAVIGSVTVPLLILVAIQMLLVVLGVIVLSDLRPVSVLLATPVATVGVALAVRATARRRLGGSTGDVLGATAELTAAAVLLMLAWAP